MTLASLSTSDWHARASSAALRDTAFHRRQVRRFGGEGPIHRGQSGDRRTAVRSERRHDARTSIVAVAAAKRTFYSRVWSRKAPRDRMAVLAAFAALIEENAERFALLDTLCMGKPITDMVTIDVPAAAKNFAYFGELIDKIDGMVTATAADAFHYILREPLGVVGCIVPWNYPLLMAAWKVAPALAAGNSVVLEARGAVAAVGLADGSAVRRGGRPARRVQRGQRSRRDGGRGARAAHGCGQDRLHRIDRNRQADADLCRPIEHEAREPGMRRQDPADLSRAICRTSTPP